MIDFSIPPELEAVRQSTTAFMEEFVYPNEDKLVEDEGLPAAGAGRHAGHRRPGF